MRSSDEVKDVVSRLQVQFGNDTRTCELKKAVPEIDLVDTKFGPYEAGVKVQLPNWIINSLIQHGIGELTHESAFETLIKVQNMESSEREDSELHELPLWLYSALREKINRFQSDKSGLDPQIYRDAQKTQKMLRNLTETRLSKILRIAKSGEYQRRLGMLTAEEQWLCKQMDLVISGWRRSVQAGPSEHSGLNTE